MNRGILIICDREEAYARRLMDFINRKGKTFEICIFTTVQALLSYISTHEADILLIEEELWEDRIAAQTKGKILLLSEGTQVGEELGYPVVYKLQPAENIEKEIMSCYAGEKLRFLPETAVMGNVKLWAVFSPVGGCGKTTLALALGQYLSREKRVLYLNMESFGSLVSENGYPGGMTDLLYYVKERRENLFMLIASLTESCQGTECIFPADYYGDITSLTEGDISWLIGQLEKTGYDIIIFDIGCMAAWVFGLLARCSRIIVPRLKEEEGLGKQAALERSLRTEGREELLTHMEKVRVPRLNSPEMEHFLWKLANNN